MTRRFRIFAVVLLIAAVTCRPSAPCCAQSQDSAQPDLNPAGSWYVTTIAGEKIVTQTLHVTADGWLLNRGENFKRLSSAEILSVMNTAATPPDDVSQLSIARLLLSNGDRLVGKLVSMTEEKIELEPIVPGAMQPANTSDPPAGSQTPQTDSVTVLQVPIESVRALEWLPGETALGAGKFSAIQNSANHDVLKLVNGDLLSGELTTIALDELQFRDDQGTRTIATSEVRAISFNPELLLDPPLIEKYSRILLSDGSVLTLSGIKLLDFNRFELQTVLAGNFQVPLEMLVSISNFSQVFVSLSLRTPTAVSYTPYLSSIPRWRADSNVALGMMRMAGGSYLTGIGVQSRTEITWPLEVHDTRFLADIGIDDSTQGGGSVMFSVLLDGEPAFESGMVRGGEFPRLIDLDLRGKKTLTLLVDFGERGDVLDRANWGQVVIEKSRSAN